MIQLKPYQSRTLEALRDFLKLSVKSGNVREAFQNVLLKNNQPIAPYLPINAPGLPEDMPYVCLRVPTGGGKTLMACHAAGIAMTDFVCAEHSVVLWLVPSTAILNQTADALRDPRHPYRRALELSCGAVDVFTINEALNLSRAAFDGQTIVIVATIQSFRVEETTGRKVYEANGNFLEHFQNLPPNIIQKLELGGDSKPVPSLVNALRLRRPIVVVDEAHNARTDLSFLTLGKVLPSCILEFTATPAREVHSSNVLYRVSASELKAAQMVKLPIRVITRHPTQKDILLADAIALRNDLEKLAAIEAQQTGEYLRPILLIQAERIADCEPLREKLAMEFQLDKNQIKISAGSLRELEDIVDVSSPQCAVRFIITVKQLAEGWDCPFAYVLCSLRESRSATAIEQIVGRILRLPHAKEKQNPDLNCGYVFSASPSVGEVLQELKDALESNGFTRAEAGKIILPEAGPFLLLGGQPQTVVFESENEADFDKLLSQEKLLGGKVKFDVSQKSLKVLIPLSSDERASLKSCAKTEQAQKQIEAAIDLVIESERAFGGTGQPRELSPYEKQLDFIVPLLGVREGEQCLEFERTFLIEHPWRLSQKDASLSPHYDPTKRPGGQVGYLDVSQRGDIRTEAVRESEGQDFIRGLHQQTTFFSESYDWSLGQLVAWVDRKIDHRDIPYSESAVFLNNVLRGLIAKHGLESSLDVLVRDRYRLKDQIEECIQAHREKEQKEVFKSWLLDSSELVVGSDLAINFKTLSYEASWFYEGGFQFKKHYFGMKPGELAGEKPSGGPTEEFLCAQFLDQQPEVKFWFRNLAKKKTSFRLQTSTDWFYPDFVCQLMDGRILVIEYKGSYLYSGSDAEEKRAVGEVWASRSKGKCVFVMPTGEDFSIIRQKITAN